jgi:hypothetical protein
MKMATIKQNQKTQEDIDAATTDIVFGTQYVASFHSRIPILGISSDNQPERCH